MKKNIKGILFLIIVVVASKLFVEAMIKTEKSHLISSESKKFDNSYKIIIDSYKKQSDLIFYNIINKPNILNQLENINELGAIEKHKIRNNLYNELLPLYDYLKSLNFRQMQIHLKDNTSFLRFHKPKIFGDSLEGVRHSVVFVNQVKKPIYGFEEGKIYNAYRFVYPLILEGKHLGSIEFSISMNAIKKEIEKNNSFKVDFFINKKYVEDKVFENQLSNYKQDILLKDFLHDKNILSNSFNSIEQIVLTQDKNLNENLKSGENQSFIISNGNKYYFTYFYPINSIIEGSSIAYLYFEEEISNLNEFISIVNISYVVLIIFVLFIFYYIYKQDFLNSKLQESEDNVISLHTQLLEKNELLKEKYNQQKSTIIHQSRLAQMGEMFTMLNHQWKQPLNALSINNSMMMYLIENEPENKEDIKKVHSNITNSLNYMNETMNTFRDFYIKDINKSYFKVVDAIEDVLSIIDNKILKENIIVEKNLDKSIEINSYKNQLKQVIMAILTNSIDALEKKENKIIKISVEKLEKKINIKISDNGPGIEKDLEKVVFEAYFSTKDQKDGTGLGLYMSRLIVEESLNGKLLYNGNDKGAVFDIDLSI